MKKSRKEKIKTYSTFSIFLFIILSLFFFVSKFGFQIYESIVGHNFGTSQFIKNISRKKSFYLKNGKIQVLSFNVKGLPSNEFPTCNNLLGIGKRLHKLRQQGKAPDIVAIQEGFHEKIYDLIEISGYPYVQQGPTGDAREMTSGLWILSEFPITISSEEIFYSCASWDCLSNKGAQMTVIKIPGTNISMEIYNTHMNVDKPNSGDVFTSKQKTNDVKISQIKQFHRYFLKNHNNKRDVIVLGDFNFRPDDMFYKYFTNVFKKIQNVSWLLFKEFAPNVVDHQFYYSYQNTILPVSYQNMFKDGLLSDHHGILVEYSLSIR